MDKEVGDQPQLVTCNKCGWVHMAVTRAYAEQQVKEFNEWFDKQDDETQESFGGKGSSVEKNYDRCFLCGPGATFRPFEEGDCPDGCTIQPTIYEEPRDHAPIDSEIYALLDSIGAGYVIVDGIVTVVDKYGETWDFTEPKKK